MVKVKVSFKIPLRLVDDQKLLPLQGITQTFCDKFYFKCQA